MSLVFPDHGIMVGKIYSAQAKLVIDHGFGRLTIKLRYSQGSSKVVACIDPISPDLERGDPVQYFLELDDLYLFIEHAKKILSEQVEAGTSVSTLCL
jgi:hypothetical protein